MMVPYDEMFDLVFRRSEFVENWLDCCVVYKSWFCVWLIEDDGSVLWEFSCCFYVGFWRGLSSVSWFYIVICSSVSLSGGGRVSLRACASYNQQDVGFHAWEGFQSPEVVSMAVYILDYDIAWLEIPVDLAGHFWYQAFPIWKIWADDTHLGCIQVTSCRPPCMWV